MVNEDLWNRTTWKNKNIDYLFGTEIVEYDVKSAALSLSKEFKLLPIDTLAMLDKMPKEARNKKIGLLQRNDHGYRDKLKQAFIDARKWFITENDLSEENILSIKKDAFFVIDHPIKHDTLGEIRFIPKNKYSTYMVLNKFEFYLNPKMNVIDIKGLGQGDDLEKVISLHGNYLLKFISNYCRMREKLVENKEVAHWLSTFVRKYKNKALPIQYYRTLSKGNSYQLYDHDLDKVIDVEDTDDLSDVVIHYNYINYILPLVSLYI
jgi:hypothetical protein